MPIVFIVAAVLSLFVAFGVRQGIVPMVKLPAPTQADTASATPLPSNVSSTPSISLSPSKRVTSSTPRVTVSPTSPQVMRATGTPISQPPSSPTSIPNSDTSAPVFEFMTGPAEGTTVNFSTFCFPMKWNDSNPSSIEVRYGLDVSPPDVWTKEYAPCYSAVADGSHVFRVQARDAAGNISNMITRNFTVNTSNPTNQVTASPTP